MQASAYVSSLGIAASVSQLAGGIHSYLEEFSSEARDHGLTTIGAAPSSHNDVSDKAVFLKPSAYCTTIESDLYDDSVDRSGSAKAITSNSCMWQGVNYTFDGRRADPLAGAHGRMGSCCYCGSPWYQFHSDVVCKVCKDQILVCLNCRENCHRRAAESAYKCSTTNKSLAPATGRMTVEAASVLGVNVSRRVGAEHTSVFLCPEHSLLSDDWQGYLRRAEQSGLTIDTLNRVLGQLRQQVVASKGRGGQGRRRTLQLQIKRLAEWLEGKVTEASEQALPQLNENPCGVSDEGSGFHPLLNLWDEN